MTSILSRLSALTEPSREVDELIALDNGWQTKTYKGKACWRRVGTLAWSPQPPRYTGSLDAALTLVPKSWTVEIHSDCQGKWFSAMRQCGVGTHIAWPVGGEARAANPAIALLFAIYKMKEGE